MKEAIDAQEDIDSYRYTDLPLKAIAGVKHLRILALVLLD